MNKLWGSMSENMLREPMLFTRNAGLNKALGTDVSTQLWKPMFRTNAIQKQALGTDGGKKDLGTDVLFQKCRLNKTLGPELGQTG